MTDFDPLQEKLDLAKLTLYMYLLKKDPEEHTKPERTVFTGLSLDKVITDALDNRDKTPASLGE